MGPYTIFTSQCGTNCKDLRAKIMDDPIKSLERLEELVGNYEQNKKMQEQMDDKSGKSD